MATEFHVFHVQGDHLSGPHRSRDTAERKAEEFRKDCPCGGEDAECGNDDMFPHGVSVSKSVDGYWNNDPEY
ncbi:hypothetical protein ACWC1C_01195 [Streptomyces sp. NPDC001705]